MIAAAAAAAATAGSGMREITTETAVSTAFCLTGATVACLY